MLLNSIEAVAVRLRRGKNVRKQFVESHINKTLAHQIRATRDLLGWSQERLAKEVGMNQNAISRLESADYGKPTITTLKRIAASMDVGLVVRLVPFSEMIDWVSGTPRTIDGLNTAALAVPSFDREEADRIIEQRTVAGPSKVRIRVGAGAAEAIAHNAAILQNQSHCPPVLAPSSSLGAFFPAHLTNKQHMLPTSALNAAEMIQ